MNILITGGAGYVGSALAAHLGADTLDYSGATLNQRYQDTPVESLGRYDTVIHLAAHSSVAACDADPVGAMKNNARDLIDFVRKIKGQVFIFASTGSLYDANRKTVYDHSKGIAEKTLEAVAAVEGVPLHILRFGTVCGAAPTMRWDTILNGMTRDAVAKGVITVANPHKFRPVLFLPDLCRYVDRILSGEITPGIRDVASFQTRIGTWADMVARVTGARIEDVGLSPCYDFRMPVLESVTTPERVVEGLVERCRG